MVWICDNLWFSAAFFTFCLFVVFFVAFFTSFFFFAFFCLLWPSFAFLPFCFFAFLPFCLFWVLSCHLTSVPLSAPDQNACQEIKHSMGFPSRAGTPTSVCISTRGAITARRRQHGMEATLHCSAARPVHVTLVTRPKAAKCRQKVFSSKRPHNRNPEVFYQCRICPE